jgi:hypothetical protein
LSLDLVGRKRRSAYRLNFADDETFSELDGDVVLSFSRLETVFGPIKTKLE